MQWAKSSISWWDTPNHKLDQLALSIGIPDGGHGKRTVDPLHRPGGSHLVRFQFFVGHDRHVRRSDRVPVREESPAVCSA